MPEPVLNNQELEPDDVFIEVPDYLLQLLRTLLVVRGIPFRITNGGLVVKESFRALVIQFIEEVEEELAELARRLRRDPIPGP